MKRLPFLLLILLVGAFVAGLARLFDLRFGAGDIYPACSSLRADPLGTKALYESLGRLVAVRRNFRPRLEAGEGADTTLFLLGIARAEEQYSLEDFKELENFAAAGGRVVISFQPSFKAPERPWFEPRPARQATNSPPARPGKKGARSPRRRPVDPADLLSEAPAASMGGRWKFEIERGVVLQDARGVYEPVVAKRSTDGRFPETLVWHTALWFDKPDPAWRIIYAREKSRALVMERRLGAGGLVLLSDSFYFTNEALRWQSHPDLLAWLVGPNRQVIFDETHLGVQEEPGVATLARKYRLHGLFAALLALAGLYVWKNSVSFLPPVQAQRAAGQPEEVTGRESAAGFVNLLRRNIRPSALLGVCFAEWKKACARTVPEAKLRQVEAIMGAEDARPVEGYRQCCEVLAKGRRNA